MDYWYNDFLRSSLRNHFVLEVCITDECSLSCKFCCQATVENKYKSHMSIDDIELLSRYINSYEFLAIKISGGEPTIHPKFEQIVSNMRKWFKVHHYTLVTNGHLLLKYSDILDNFDDIEISHYIGINDDIVNQIKKSSINVPIKFIEREDNISMHNVFSNPNLEKKNIFLRCRYPAWKKVVKNRIYPCSNIFGEAVREKINFDKVSVVIGETWRESLESLDIESYCKNCWVNVGDPIGRACRIL